MFLLLFCSLMMFQVDYLAVRCCEDARTLHMVCRFKLFDSIDGRPIIPLESSYAWAASGYSNWSLMWSPRWIESSSSDLTKRYKEDLAFGCIWIEGFLPTFWQNTLLYSNPRYMDTPFAESKQTKVWLVDPARTSPCWEPKGARSAPGEVAIDLPSVCRPVSTCYLANISSFEVTLFRSSNRHWLFYGRDRIHPLLYGAIQACRPQYRSRDQDRSGQIDRSGMRDYDIEGAFKSRVAVTMSEAPSSRRLLAVPFVAKARGDRWCEYKDVWRFIKVYEHVWNFITVRYCKPKLSSIKPCIKHYSAVKSYFPKSPGQAQPCGRVCPTRCSDWLHSVRAWDISTHFKSSIGAFTFPDLTTVAYRRNNKQQ